MQHPRRLPGGGALALAVQRGWGGGCAPKGVVCKVLFVINKADALNRILVRAAGGHANKEPRNESAAITDQTASTDKRAPRSCITWAVKVRARSVHVVCRCPLPESSLSRVGTAESGRRCTLLTRTNPDANPGNPGNPDAFFSRPL
eukprot:357270-Chlamydomonas_euryale.AAC.13